jgi:hypothetical protein
MATTVAPAPSADAGVVRVQGMGLGRWLRTTPGRLRIASVVLLIGLVVVGVVAATAASARGDAARAVGFDRAPALVAAQNLAVALSDADATATSIFLTPGDEPRELRQRYLDNIEAAGRHLVEVADIVGSDTVSRRATAAISEMLPAYTARIDTARANIRQGFPVGAAYQRDGSGLMRDEILPEATALYRRAADDLHETFRSGTSTSEIVVVLVAGGIVLVILIGVQVFVARRTNRILNIPLVAATGLVLVLLVWTVTRFSTEQDALVRAQRNGSDQMQVLSSARILGLRMQSDDNLALVERGTSDQYVVDFDVFSKRLGGADGRDGLLGVATAIAARTGTEDRIRTLSEQFAVFRAEHEQVRELDAEGRYDAAVARSIEQEAEAARALDAGLRGEIARARRQLDDASADARRGFGVLGIAIPVLVVLTGVLVFLGLQRRIAEYHG